MPWSACSWPTTAEGRARRVTGAKGSAFRETAMEKALTANFSADALAGVKITADDMNADIHGSAEYRAHLVGVMAKRAVAAAK